MLKVPKIWKTFVLTISNWLILKIPPWIVCGMFNSVHLLYCLSWCVSVAFWFLSSSNSFSASVYVLLLVPTNASCILGLCPCLLMWWPELNSRCLPLALQVASLPEPGVPLSAWWLTDWSVSARVLLSLLHARTGLTKVHTMPDFLQGARDMDSALPVCTASPLPTEPSPQLLWFLFFCKAVFRQTNAHLLPCAPCFNLVRSFSIWFFHSEN